MIEAGLANIASNLPLFRGLLKDTLFSVISIVRSSISLMSRRNSFESYLNSPKHDLEMV